MEHMDRFEDALDIRARQGWNRDGGDYAYKAGYLIALLQGISCIPEVAQHIENSRIFLEQMNAEAERLDESTYMGA